MSEPRLPLFFLTGHVRARGVARRLVISKELGWTGDSQLSSIGVPKLDFPLFLLFLLSRIRKH